MWVASKCSPCLFWPFPTCPRTSPHRRPPDTGLTCQTRFPSLFPWPIPLGRQGPGLGFSRPTQDAGKSRTKPSQSWRPHSQGHPMSVSRGTFKGNVCSKGLSRDAEPDRRPQPMPSGPGGKASGREAAHGNVVQGQRPERFEMSLCAPSTPPRFLFLSLSCLN